MCKHKRVGCKRNFCINKKMSMLRIRPTKQIRGRKTMYVCDKGRHNEKSIYVITTKLCCNQYVMLQVYKNRVSCH